MVLRVELGVPEGLGGDNIELNQEASSLDIGQDQSPELLSFCLPQDRVWVDAHVEHFAVAQFGVVQPRHTEHGGGGAGAVAALGRGDAALGDGPPAFRPSGVAPSTMPRPMLAVTAAAAAVDWASWKPGVSATTSET